VTNFFSFDNLTYYFEPGGRSIQVSGAVEPGNVLALQGPSGSGKSTILRILARLLEPAGGEVVFRGQGWLSFPPLTWRRRIHYLPQKPVMFAGTVLDNLWLPFGLAALSDMPKPGRDYLEGLVAAAGLPPSILTQDALTLSGGEMARVALVRALLVEPDVLLLDEPTAFLDEGTERLVQTLLCNWLQEKKERAAILVSHKDEDLQAFPGLRVVNITPSEREG